MRLELPGKATIVAALAVFLLTAAPPLPASAQAPLEDPFALEDPLALEDLAPEPPPPATDPLAAGDPLALGADEEEFPVLSLDDIPDEVVGIEPEPGLGEATEEALANVLDAARRDSTHWAKRTTELPQQLWLRFTDAFEQLRRDPPGTVDAWLAQAGLPDSQTLLIPSGAVLFVLVVILVLLRGSGDLKVAIGYPAELRGTFHVRVSRRQAAGRHGPRIASPAAAERAKRKAGSSSRTDRHLVSRETDFNGIRTGHWYVSLDGFVQPQDDETVIGTYFEEQEVRIRRGGTVRVEFDFHPKQCPVDVKVLWDKRPVSEALVAWRGVPHSLRYARGGPVRIGAPQGDQVLVVGSGDRVAEVAVSVPSFQPISVELDLADRGTLLFTGCPPAVEPYLHGDVGSAARALEREGHESVSHLILARLHEERGQLDSAARHYADAGDAMQAAAIREQLGQFTASATLYESAGELVRAAEMHRSAGDIEKAGEAFERARDFESAVSCFKEAGSISKWIEVLEKSGDPYQAARVALDKGEESRAIRSLQLVGPQDDDYIEAGNLLVEVLEREGHIDLAVEKVQEIIRTRGADQVPLETCDRLAGLLEKNGQHERAIDVLDIIRRRDATYPNVATRIEDLRKKRKEGNDEAAGTDAFSSAFRYEILEEVGRGGMGIVFKARDQRLGRVVALKRLPDNLRNHPKAVELFLREARAAAALNHPNIVTVHDAGREGDTFFITMELLEGHPLIDVLKRNGKLGARDVARLGVQVTNGLEYAHDQGIVHRDIKTANLFFTRSKTLKIMDFGLAKMVEEVRRASTVIGGTPYYMAPEQSLGESVDARADLYALGVTFYELLTGKVPFPDGDVAYHHRHTEPVSPTEKDGEVPADFAELVLDLMQKDPDDRPGSASRVRERLQAILEALG